MAIAHIVVGALTPRVQDEIEALGGSVRQICKHPTLFLVQLPCSRWVSDNPAIWGVDAPRDPNHVRPDVEIGTKDGQGYLLLRSDGWMCEYRQHPYDVAHTALRSLNDPLLSKRKK